MNNMNIPGFTAEASLYNINERYRATTDVPHYDGVVQPAISADLTKDVLSGFSQSDLINVARCFRYRCFYEIDVYGHISRHCGWTYVC